MLLSRGNRRSLVANPTSRGQGTIIIIKNHQKGHTYKMNLSNYCEKRCSVPQPCSLRHTSLHVLDVFPTLTSLTQMICSSGKQS